MIDTNTGRIGIEQLSALDRSLAHVNIFSVFWGNLGAVDWPKRCVVDFRKGFENVERCMPIS